MSLSKYISEKELINGNTFLLASIFGRTKNSLHNLFFTERQNLFNAKFRFYLHSWKYKFPGICPNRSHDASRRHNPAVHEKEHEEAVVAGRSLPLGRVVQHAPSNSSIVQ